MPECENLDSDDERNRGPRWIALVHQPRFSAGNN